MSFGDARIAESSINEYRVAEPTQSLAARVGFVHAGDSIALYVGIAYPHTRMRACF